MHGRPSGTVDDVVAYLKNNPLPDGISMTWEAIFKRQNDSFGVRFGIADFVLTDLFDYGSLVRQLHLSFCCLICHTCCRYWSIFILEFIVKQFELIYFARFDYVNGIGNKNSILIVDFTNQLKAEENITKRHWLPQEERMRPILMTTLSMAMGMLPIALRPANSSWMEKRDWRG